MRYRAGLVVLMSLALAAAGCRPPSAGEEVVQGCALHGIVIDAKTHQPIFSVAIRVEGTKLGAMSDSSGHFCIPQVPAGKYALWVGTPGYATMHLKNVVVPRDSGVVLLARMKMQTVDVEKNLERSTSSPRE